MRLDPQRERPLPDVVVPPPGPDGRVDLRGRRPVDPAAREELLALVATLLHKGRRLPAPLVLCTSARPNQPEQWELEVTLPIDLAWLAAHAHLPEEVRLLDYGPPILPVVDVAGVAIWTAARGDSSRWRDAGWVSGEPYAGPLPPPRSRRFRRGSAGH